MERIKLTTYKNFKKLEKGAFKIKDLSIIIPAYNAALYIEKCIDSVLHLKEIDYEILVIDDGSKDNTLEVLEKYSNHLNITIFSQENQGQGIARNKGLDLAQGRYISYMDADDYIEVDKFIKIFNEIKSKDLDFIITEALEIDEFGNILRDRKKHPDILKLGVVSGREMLKNLVNKKSFSVEVCLNIYKKNFLIENKLYFKEYFYEDHLYAQQSFFYAQKVMYMEEYFYHYVRRSNTVTTSNNLSANEKRLKSVKQLITDLIEFNKNNNLLSKEWNFLTVSNYYNYIFFLKQNRDKSMEKEISFKNLTLKDRLKYIKIILWRG